MKINVTTKLSLLGLLLVAAPACWNKKQVEQAVDTDVTEVMDDGSEVLISIDGKAKLTVKSFEKMIDDIASENEQFKMMLQFMPDLKEQVFKAKKQAIVHEAYAQKEGIADSAEYKNKQKMIGQAIKDQLNHEYFVKNHKAEVSDADVKKFYDESKDKDPRLKKSSAGVKVAAVSFKTDAEAEEFKNKVNNSTFDKTAKDENLTTKDLGTDGLVTEDSFQVATDARKAILNAKVPSVIVVKDGDNYLVVNVKSKVPATYHDFNKVKEGLKQMLQAQKTEEVSSKATDEYADKIGLKTNTKYFDDIKKHHEEEAQKAAQEFAKSQEAQKPADNTDAHAKELAVVKPVSPSAA